MPCKVRLMKHACYNSTASDNMFNEWVNHPGSHGVNWNDTASSINVSGCNNKYAVTVYEHGAGEQNNPNQSVYTIKDGYWTSTNDHCKNSQFDDQWLIQGEISSVKIENLPQDDIKEGGQITYEIDIGKHPGQHQGYNTSLGGHPWNNKWRPDAGGKHTEHPLGHGIKGDPCTSAARTRIWTQSSSNASSAHSRPAKMHCTFGIDTQTLQRLNDNSKASNDPRRKMYNNIIGRVCNTFKVSNPGFKYGDGDKRCWDYFDDSNLKKEYCFKDDRMSTDTLCTKSNLGDSYEILAQEYCENNSDKAFCACSNVMQPGFCEQAPNAPGCKTVQPIWDNITQSLDEEDIAQFEGMQPCYAGVCGGTVYQPTGWDTRCGSDISICKADFDLGGDLVGSNITVKQNCGNDSGDGDGSGSGSGSTTTTNDQEKTLIEKVFKIEEDKDKKFGEKRSVKILGTVSSASMCFMCMASLVLFT